MRTIRYAIAVVIGLAVMLILAANMSPVDLHIVPAALGIPFFSLSGIPLALVIVLALLVGIFFGLLIEFFRESKHRAKLAEKRRELARLRDENERLAQRLGEDPEELSLIPG